MQLGLHFRLDEAEIAPVLAAAGDDARLLRLLARLEEDPAVFARACETDKAWDPIACALSPAGEDGPWPARGVIGGARPLHVDDEESWVTHLSPDEAAEVAGFLHGLDDAQFSRAYAAMPEELRNPEYGPDEERYALGWLSELRTFFAAASAERAHVVFSVLH
ncbi:YfbM family protein [Leucobacter allii]|uniref:DUF1877 family protein n=1 Tax=Leucobacter allii TaxID=2932247 RepID=UPI001FD5FCF0|nr:DUF1877 family protein [Leucobacter allii]UOR03280.1 YfbM family protein [Leucobacter allii]